MSGTTVEMIPQLRAVAEKIIAVIEAYPSTPYTKNNLDALDQIMFLIERAEGEHQGEQHGNSQTDRRVREGHSEGQAALPTDW